MDFHGLHKIYMETRMPLSKSELKSKIAKEKLPYHDYSTESPIKTAAASSILGRSKYIFEFCTIEKIGEMEFYGIFDGHIDWKVAAMLKETIPKRLTVLESVDMADIATVTEIVRGVCWNLGKDIFQFKSLEYTGSMAIFALKFQTHLYVVNIGNSMAILFDSDNKIKLQTKMHTIVNDFPKRIEDTGTMVIRGLIDGQLNVARGFGYNSHNYRSLHYPNKPTNYDGFNVAISSEPDVYYLTIPPNEKFYLVMGSNSFWEDVSLDEIFDSVKTSSLSEASKKLTKTALENKNFFSSETYHRNVTVVVSEFN